MQYALKAWLLNGIFRISNVSFVGGMSLLVLPRRHRISAAEKHQCGAVFRQDDRKTSFPMILSSERFHPLSIWVRNSAVASTRCVSPTGGGLWPIRFRYAGSSLEISSKEL